MSYGDMSSNGCADVPFPTGSLVPKAETGVLSFLQKYPNFDGRDVTIAIFDSGVDPRAAGLETLSDGKSVKVIERFDCSGCGDVSTTKKVTADAMGFITGLSGRQLKLTDDMITKNITKGEFRVGLKNAYHLCPSKARDCMVSLMKTKEWDGPHKIAVAEISRKIDEFDAQNPETTKMPLDKKLVKDDLDNTLEFLNSFEKMYNDVKTSYDCILYRTEFGWRAVIDNTEKGDLENALHIGEYSKTHEVKNINDYLSVSINVHDDGDVLELVGMCSPHGTHVASIASCNDSCKDTNGVAPNAKIVSLTIGDGRLGSMETGSGLVRAMMKVMEMCRSGTRIDVINMSYGEHAQWSNAGRIGELMCEVVNKYGVVWVASAGNHGPALCTVGTPPDVYEPCCIGVGAYVSPQMMEAEYSMREKLPANVFTWTSRDPCIDGGQGVTICAPGSAITSVPLFTMAKTLFMNGTSMAAPHVAGAIALMISGLKQKGIKYSPYSIKRAICATATKLDYIDVFAQGSGLLNVEKSFEHLVQYENSPDTMIRYLLRCGVQEGKGIHIREGFLKKPSEYSVDIEPIFMNEKETAAEDKLNFNVRLNLVSTQQFVECGAFLDLSYVRRSVRVKIDPTGLPPGVHTATVRAYDSECVQRGPLFCIPVTVVQPHVVNCELSRTYEPIANSGYVEFHPNTIQRDFILVPQQASWAVLRIRSTGSNAGKNISRFFVHTVQLLSRFSCKALESTKLISVGPDKERTLTFKCKGNNIVEVCIAKYWSNYGSVQIKYSVEFHGITVNNSNACVMHAAFGIHRFEVSALKSEDLHPFISLKNAVVVLKPIESKISPLSASRDVIPEGRQIYQNVLTYNLHIGKSHDVALDAPLFSSLLYESEYESQLWMLFDSNKALIMCGDSYSNCKYTKLEKGDYTIKLQIRHEKRDILDKISEANMLAFFKLSNAIALDIYDHYNQCVINGRKFSTGIVRSIPSKCLYVSALSQEKLSKASLPNHCTWLTGSLALAKDDSGRRLENYDFNYYFNALDGTKRNGNGGANSSAANNGPTAAGSGVNNSSNANAGKTKANGGGVTTMPPVSPPAVSEGGAATGSPSPRRSKTHNDEYAEGLRDFQCAMITKCDLEKAETIYKEVIATHPKHLSAHLLLIQNIEANELKTIPGLPLTFAKWCGVVTTDDSSDDKRKSEQERVRSQLERIVQLCDLVIKYTDQESLLAYYGLKYDARPDAAKIKSTMDKHRSNLVEALARKGVVTSKLSVFEGNTKERLDVLDSTYADILKYVDATDNRVINFSMWHAYAHSQFGRLTKYLQKMFDDKRSAENFEELLLVAGAFNYDHVQTVVRRLTVSSLPSDYRLF